MDRVEASGYAGTVSRPSDPARAVPSIGDHAADHLRFIRQTMERSATFTAVPGWGGVAMGTVGLIAAFAAAAQPTPERWLLVWLAAAAVALALGLAAMWRKAARMQVPLGAAPVRRFGLSLAAPLAAGAALTWGLWTHGAWALMPPAWLLLYGTGVLTGGAFSVAPVQWLGGGFMALGVAALASPADWGTAWLALGFGALQVLVGLHIARRYGG